MQLHARGAVVSFPRAALFDLDGTLLDSAPDMLATVNAMLDARGRAPLALASLRPVVSKGARAMLGVAFAELDAAACAALVPEFLQRYEGLIGTQSQLFDGIEQMLVRLEDAGCAVLIGGDTLAERKPHPLPLVIAAERIGVAPAQCVYVGDDERDIVAARAAAMASVAALWGYRLDDDDPTHWQADVLVEQPQALWNAATWPQI